MLAIREARFDCLLVGGATGERSGQILGRLLTGLKSELPAAFGRVELDGEGLAYIEHLELTAEIDLDWSDTTIARTIAGSLMESIQAALAAPETVRFLDQADRMARFLLDLADGAAFTKAWHEEFAGLRLLPASAILRSFAQLDAETTLLALGRLSVAQRRRVVRLLARKDAERTLAQVSRAPGQPARDPAIIARAFRGLGRASLAGSDAAVHALILAAALYADCSLTADEVTYDIAAALLAGELPESATMPDTSLATSEREANAQTFNSPHGGVWLLLPELLDLGVGAQQALIVLACCAGADAWDVWQDAGIREALTVPPGVGPIDVSSEDGPRPAVAASRDDLEHLREGSRRLGLASRARVNVHRLAVAAMRSYARRLPGFAGSSLSYLWRNLLAAPALVMIEEAGLSVILTPCPLHVLWRISGADRADYLLPDGRSVVVRGSK